MSVSSYDPQTNPELSDVFKQLKERQMTPKLVEKITTFAKTKDLTPVLQIQTDNGYSMTMGALIDSAADEIGDQYIYPDRVEHVLFGTHGLAKGYKLSNSVQVAVLKNELTGHDQAPIISAGRHRVTSIAMMLQHLEIPNWRDCKIQVEVKRPSSPKELAQLIVDNNDSRKMKNTEKQQYKLTQFGVKVATESDFYDNPMTNARRTRTTGFPTAFAAGVKLACTSETRADLDRIATAAATAFRHLYNASPANRSEWKRIFNFDAGHEGGKTLKLACRYVADNFIKSEREAIQRWPQKQVRNTVPRVLAEDLALLLKLDSPVSPY